MVAPPDLESGIQFKGNCDREFEPPRLDQRLSMIQYKVWYISCEGNERWMYVESDSEDEARSYALCETECYGDGVAEVLEVLECGESNE
jgi:hypothetical protein